MAESSAKITSLVKMLRGTEWLWGGAGLGIASLSACFAAYMLAFGPSQPSVSGLGDFGLFARMRPGERVADNPIAPGQGAEGAAVATATAPIDFAPTGSLADRTDSLAAKTSTPAASGVAASEKVLSSFILRDVFDGQALVESPSAITLVSKGSMIDGAGEVLSIERRGNTWAVVTRGGIIGGLK